MPLATRAIAEQRRWAVAGGPAEPLLKELRAVSQGLSALAHSPVPEDPAQRQEQGKWLAQLNESKETLEKKLAEVSRPFRRDQGLQSARVDDLLAALPADTVVVDFVQTRTDRAGDLLAGLPRSAAPVRRVPHPRRLGQDRREHRLGQARAGRAHRPGDRRLARGPLGGGPLAPRRRGARGPAPPAGLGADRTRAR